MQKALPIEICEIKDSSFRRNKIFITTYPSTIFTGDFSLGLEANHKRIRQEFAIFYKTFNVIRSYSFDRGYRMSYFLKYNFIKRKNNLLSFDLTYLYMQKSYENRIEPYIYYLSVYEGIKNPPKPIYRSDRSLRIFGPGIGLSNLVRLYKRFFLGVNLNAYVVNYKFHYSLKEHISGPELEDDVDDYGLSKPIQLPYNRDYTAKKRVYVNCLIKIVYCL